MITIASYGGGTNSTAMLIEMAMRGEPAPHAILFADTGGEKPHTYAHVEEFSAWLEKQGYPRITTVKKVTRDGDVLTLEQNCLNKAMLPSIAYGFKTCSQKYKIQPQEKWANNDPACKAEWAAGRKVVKLIGFDAGEPQRATERDDPKYTWRYPLIEWGITRADCVKIIESCQISLPGKSSCFFCPNMRPAEIRQLGRDYPDLLQRALDMEANADLTTIKGLGRGNFSWRDVMAQGDMFDGGFWEHEPPYPCECMDGEAA